MKIRRFTFFRGDRFTKYSFAWFRIIWSSLIRHRISESSIPIGYRRAFLVKRRGTS